MIVLMRIIGWEAPRDNLKTPEDRPPVPGTDEARPDSCPSCLAPAWEDGKLTLVGHGSYQRWIKEPGEGRIGVRRFLCEREDCGKTCSVLPHWVLPRFQYIAPLVLTSLSRYHVGGETARSVTAEFGLSSPKHGWGTLRRWGSAFLVSTILWGWLGTRLGVRKGTSRSRDQVRIHLERFTRSFTDRVTPNAVPSIPEIVRLSLGGRVFDGGKAWSSRHPPGGRIMASLPHRTRSGPPTQGAGPPRAPP
jgi:hypothetical protein